jgi:hypothetical protein
MKIKIYLVFILVFLSLQFAAAKPPEADTVKRGHLLVKCDIFYPIFYLIAEDKDESYSYGGGLEYKFKNRFSAQLGAYIFQFSDGSLQKGYRIIPEGRYYFKGHFVGAYIKYEQRNYVDGPIYRVSAGRFVEYEFLWTVGGLYGYQLELGRFNLEGRLGIGAAHNFYHHVASGSHDKGHSKGSIFPEMIVAIHIGCKIF